jgi:hypothetical protein
MARVACKDGELESMKVRGVPALNAAAGIGDVR